LELTGVRDLMDNKELVKTAEKVIGISRLRREVPSIKSRTKQEFIENLYSNNRPRLEWLVAYYTQLKKRNAFFAYSKSPLNFKGTEGKKVRHKTTDLIFEFNNVAFGDASVVVNVKAHSEIFEYKVEEPEKLTPFDVRFRRGFTIFFIYHTGDSIIEVKTRSLGKFEILKSLLEETFSLPADTIALIKIGES
jgi:hypothetical protein